MAKKRATNPRPLRPYATDLLSKISCNFSVLLCLVPCALLLLVSSSRRPWHTFVVHTVATAGKSDAPSSPLKHTNEDGGGDAQVFDLYNGTWVWDTAGGAPQYMSTTCPTLPALKNCDGYGKDQGFVRWRWRPHGCEVLPRFDAGRFLRTMRGEKMAFVGDSVARNQMESLLCLLSHAEAPTNTYRDADDRSVAWHFKSHDFTLMILWTKFLVEASQPRAAKNSPASEVYVLHLDKPDAGWTAGLDGADIAVVSSGHWFFRKNYLLDGGELVGCTYCSDPNVTDLGVVFPVRLAFRTALWYITGRRNLTNMLTLVRTFSPAHFEHGAWNGGGYCNRTEPAGEGEVRLAGTDWEVRSAQVEEAENARAGRGWRFLDVLDVTKAMAMRPDGHPGIHWNNEWMKGYSDCVHWRLPGPIDVWNQLLLLRLERFGEEVP